MNIRYVKEIVANLWLEPETVREADRPALGSPIQLHEWMEMDLKERKDLVGRLESQVLYGEPVLVDEERDGWSRVSVPGQFTPKDPRGYPGWIPSAQLGYDPDFHHALEREPLVRVTADRSRLILASGERVEISFMTKLPKIGEADGEVVVLTPDGRAGRLPAEDVRIGQTPVQSPEDRIRTAEGFIGLPYLWAGMSSFGFDCSGFMYRIFESGGIRIPRDADIQATCGERVSWEELAPGDLVFFAYEQGKGTIHHVGMYIGEGAFIHSPHTGNPIRINRLTDEPYHGEFCWGTRYRGGEIPK
ncbi:NlpC/P60 family protein [Melghirimyces profundicolus]|uniref:NlpC/P60 family protein n=1 Tax=Melghirimyces profundicolus TaxID=1242148 RepID=A0A2T6C9D3_9BACL|nr:C40 family peptidase [Melghirimyces profundicolus]PTX64937.1 NlpC/P60 family protein [Melghirimyces profundicolus]